MCVRKDPPWLQPGNPPSLFDNAYYKLSTIDFEQKLFIKAISRRSFSNIFPGRTPCSPGGEFHTITLRPPLPLTPHTTVSYLPTSTLSVRMFRYTFTFTVINVQCHLNLCSQRNQAVHPKTRQSPNTASRPKSYRWSWSGVAVE